CLAAVADGKAEAAGLPAENIIDGLIGSTFDALIEFKESIRVFDEISLRILHVLAAREKIPEDAIRWVYSHPSALNQCARVLSAIAPAAQFIPVGSTAEAAWRVAQDARPDVAAICSEEAAAAQNLCVLRPWIGDDPLNQTRFLICGRKESAPTGDDLTLIAVHYGRNEPGQLYRTAGAFAVRGLDLTSVHSRPYRRRPRQYVLLFEVCGHRADEKVAAALAEIEEQVRETGGWVVVLGSYPRRDEC
ncbi:MAG: prephenate dehydratase, partial [Bacillota bacterium]